MSCRYWLGLSTKRSERLDKIHSKPGMTRIVYALPGFMQPKAGAVREYNGYLYIGGDLVSPIGKYDLKNY